MIHKTVIQYVLVILAAIGVGIGLASLMDRDRAPESCITALDSAEAMQDKMLDTMRLSAEAFDAAARGDVQRMDEISGEIGALADPVADDYEAYLNAADQCRKEG